MKGLLQAAMLLSMVAADHQRMGDRISRPVESERKRYRPEIDPELQREIAAHNAAVDCRKAEKRAAKRGRITKGQQT
jgi:hypothetical protein